MKIIIGYISAFYATKMGSKDSWETKGNPHWVSDPPWSFNGPCMALQYTQNGDLLNIIIFLTFFQTKD